MPNYAGEKSVSTSLRIPFMKVPTLPIGQKLKRNQISGSETLKSSFRSELQIFSSVFAFHYFFINANLDTSV